MVGHNPQFTYRKDGVFYFSRRIPKDIRHKYEHDRFVMCLRTKSRVVADKSSRAIAARLDEYWMSLRIADLNIPSILPVNGQVATVMNKYTFWQEGDDGVTFPVNADS